MSNNLSSSSSSVSQERSPRQTPITANAVPRQQSTRDQPGHANGRTRGRFSWVRRLVMGPTRPTGSQYTGAARAKEGAGLSVPVNNLRDPSATRQNRFLPTGSEGNESLDLNSIITGETYGTPNLNLHMNDNVSTMPLKSLSSLSTTKSSVLGGDSTNVDSATMATSITPSTPITMNPSHSLVSPVSDQTPNHLTANPNNDAASIVTLASSTRVRGRGRSMESTNALTVGIPPASILERGVPSQSHSTGPITLTPAHTQYVPLPGNTGMNFQDRTSMGRMSTYATSSYSFSRFDDEGEMDDGTSMHTGGHVLRGDIVADEDYDSAPKSIKS
ncbi:hypothetical protein BABINDRAFT_161558 [Babjeviella inositovora NRRL Y-12698]|uniref:Uncharacterized protein n=1 Tax=Babjeviella inositovora NRRL Y-12698 TaxID=984486 RepID=A0A1E3QQD0_9ASCO|nr:uncharacterized protein BABINDRAFT_161558 [Babjeviella inositovora NRRL Y-12698]ODQ79885.1 hypothetical protein BABINDRAFT_161558 [Babjeviella inositovora NRRL Y-12698]